MSALLLGYTVLQARSLVLKSGKILLVTVTVSLELSPCFINVPLNSSKCLYIIQIAGNSIYLLLYLICFSLKYNRCTSRPIRKSFISKEPLIQPVGGFFLLWLQGPWAAGMKQLRWRNPAPPTSLISSWANSPNFSGKIVPRFYSSWF